MLFDEQRVKIIKETILSRDTLTRHWVSKERYRSQKLRFYLMLLLLYSSSFAFYTFISITYIPRRRENSCLLQKYEYFVFVCIR